MLVAALNDRRRHDEAADRSEAGQPGDERAQRRDTRAEKTDQDIKILDWNAAF